MRVRRQALAEEREALARAVVHGLPQEDPHAHLRRRPLPNVDPARTRTRVLRIWSAVSATVLLTGLALVILGQFGALLPAVGSLAVVMLCAEAFARGHLVQFVAGLLAIAVVAAAAGLATWAALGHWRPAIAIFLLLAAAALLFASIRDFFTKRCAGRVRGIPGHGRHGWERYQVAADGAYGEEISLPAPLNFSLATATWPFWK